MNDAVQDSTAQRQKPSKKFGAKPNFWTKRYWLTEAVKLSALYIALSPMVAMPLYTHLIFFPDKTDYSKTIAYPLEQLKKQINVDHEDVFFNTPDGKRLHGIYFACPGAKKVVFVCHGNGGNIAHRMVLAAALLVCKANVFLFDYQGYGSSEGSPSLKGVVTDGVAAYDYLHQTRHVDPTNIFVYGESLGSGVATQVAEQRPVAGIILQSGFSSLVSAGKDRFFFLRAYPDSWFPENLDNVAALRKPHAPVLIIHGKDDPILAVHNATDLFAQACEPKRLVLIDNFGHYIGRVDSKEYSESIIRFLQSPGSR
ncbi:MAG TPA: alpha/beta hydrolase [Trichormus sp.]